MVFFKKKLCNYIIRKLNNLKIEHKQNIMSFIWENNNFIESKLKKIKKTNSKSTKYRMMKLKKKSIKKINKNLILKNKIKKLKIKKKRREDLPTIHINSVGGESSRVFFFGLYYNSHIGRGGAEII